MAIAWVGDFLFICSCIFSHQTFIFKIFNNAQKFYRTFDLLSCQAIELLYSLKVLAILQIKCSRKRTSLICHFVHFPEAVRSLLKIPFECSVEQLHEH